MYKSGKKRGETCENKAYFRCVDKTGTYYLCGLHGKGKAKEKLPEDPRKEEKQAEEIARLLEAAEVAAETNREQGLLGDIIVSKLRMRKAPPHVEGYLSVFPNYKHQGRKDGFGAARLSPKSLGPVPHKVTGLPLAKNLENYHQGAKVFPCEVDAEGNITPEALELRKRIYLDPEPYRHKFEAPYYYTMLGCKPEKIKGNKNIPLYSLFYRQDGSEARLSYLESRYMYSHWYEVLAAQENDFLTLQDLIEEGYNLNIIGYDGYRVIEKGDEDLPLEEILWKHYLDTSRPFGHELVLYTLLTLPVFGYPWNRYYREHPEVYADLI